MIRRVLTRLHRRGSPQEKYTGVLYGAAGQTFEDYAAAVTAGAPREDLAKILTGLAGCELALTHYDRPGNWAGHDRAGHLLLEVAYAAEEGAAYRGVRNHWFRASEDTSSALRTVAFAYATAPDSAWPLSDALTGLHRDARVDALLPLIDAHRTAEGGRS